MNRPEKIEVNQKWKIDVSATRIDNIYVAKILTVNHGYCDFEIIESIQAINNNRPVGYIYKDYPCNEMLRCPEYWTYLGMAMIEETPIKYGVHCQKCNEYNQYAEFKPNFVCYGCKC